MFQSNVFSKACSKDRVHRKRASRQKKIGLLSKFIPIDLAISANEEGIVPIPLARSKSEKQKKVAKEAHCLTSVKEAAEGSLAKLETKRKLLVVHHCFCKLVY